MIPERTHPLMSSSPVDVLLPHRPTDAPPPTAVYAVEPHSLVVALAAVLDPRDPGGKRYPLTGPSAGVVATVSRADGPGLDGYAPVGLAGPEPVADRCASHRGDQDFFTCAD